MNYVKAIGLVAVGAMALMEFVGAGTAAATVLCKTNMTSGCAAAGWDYQMSWLFHATLGAESTLETTGGSILQTCSSSTIKGQTTTTGGVASTVLGSVVAADWHWGSCKYSTVTTAGGELEIHHTAGTDHGVLTAKGFTFGLSGSPFGECFYSAGNGTTLGTITPNSGTPIVHINAIMTEHVMFETSGAFCPDNARWIARYTITTPSPLYISAS